MRCWLQSLALDLTYSNICRRLRYQTCRPSSAGRGISPPCSTTALGSGKASSVFRFKKIDYTSTRWEGCGFTNVSMKEQEGLPATV